jgi:hypothetical protein
MNQQFPSLVVTLVVLFVFFFLQESHWCIEQSGQLPDFDRRVVFDTSGLNRPILVRKPLTTQLFVHWVSSPLVASFNLQTPLTDSWTNQCVGSCSEPFSLCSTV